MEGGARAGPVAVVARAAAAAVSAGGARAGTLVRRGRQCTRHARRRVRAAHLIPPSSAHFHKTPAVASTLQRTLSATLHGPPATSSSRARPPPFVVSCFCAPPFIFPPFPLTSAMHVAHLELSSILHIYRFVSSRTTHRRNAYPTPLAIVFLMHVTLCSRLYRPSLSPSPPAHRGRSCYRVY